MKTHSQRCGERASAQPCARRSVPGYGDRRLSSGATLSPDNKVDRMETPMSLHRRDISRRSFICQNSIIGLTSSLPLLAVTPSAAYADEQSDPVGPELIRKAILEQGPWWLSSTAGDPKDSSAHWNTYPVAFEASDGKITMNYASMFYGSVAAAIQFKPSGFAWTPPTGGAVEMTFSAIGAEFPFVGSGNGYTFRLSRKR
jgi:hypothetical protein